MEKERATVGEDCDGSQEKERKEKQNSGAVNNLGREVFTMAAVTDGFLAGFLFRGRRPFIEL